MANSAQRLGHDLSSGPRTEDVALRDNLPFEQMNLCVELKKALKRCNFAYPTGIQASAIPLGIAGIDLIVNSKAGTGKTLIYCSTILERFSSKIYEPQALVVLPTRELAVQVDSILNELCRYIRNYKVALAIGGTAASEDRKHIAGAKVVVGTPGRLLHLIKCGVFNTKQVRILVLDEADRLLEKPNLNRDVDKIINALNEQCQVIACTATFEKAVPFNFARIMKIPMVVSTEKKCTALVGIKQFVYILPERSTSFLEMQQKLEAVKYIFSILPFQQSVLFASSQSRAESYCNYLAKDGWPCDLMSGALNQNDRNEVFSRFRRRRIRILVATDLMSRGIDSEDLNLVINIEMPSDFATYLHRIGRAGRFGSKGISITFLSSSKDHHQFSKFLNETQKTMNVCKFPTRNCYGGDGKVDFWDFRNRFPNYSASSKSALNSHSQSSSNAVQNYGNNENNPRNNTKRNPKNKDKTSVLTEKAFNSKSNKEHKRKKNNFHADMVGNEEVGRDANVEETLESHHVESPEKLTIPKANQFPCNESDERTQKGQFSEISLNTSTENLPLSSNTIDDASSLVPDSLLTSRVTFNNQFDLEKKVPAVDFKTAEDIFDDYEAFVAESDEETSKTNTVDTRKKPGIPHNLEHLLIDKNLHEGKKLKESFDPFKDYEEFTFSNNSKENLDNKSVNSATYIIDSTKPKLDTSANLFRLHSAFNSIVLTKVNDSEDASEKSKPDHKKCHNTPVISETEDLACGCTMARLSHLTISPLCTFNLPAASRKLESQSSESEMPRSSNSVASKTFSDKAVQVSFDSAKLQSNSNSSTNSLFKFNLNRKCTNSIRRNRLVKKYITRAPQNPQDKQQEITNYKLNTNNINQDEVYSNFDSEDNSDDDDLYDEDYQETDESTDDFDYFPEETNEEINEDLFNEIEGNNYDNFDDDDDYDDEEEEEGEKFENDFNVNEIENDFNVNEIENNHHLSDNSKENEDSSIGDALIEQNSFNEENSFINSASSLDPNRSTEDSPEEPQCSSSKVATNLNANNFYKDYMIPPFPSFSGAPKSEKLLEIYNKQALQMKQYIDYYRHMQKSNPLTPQFLSTILPPVATKSSSESKKPKSKIENDKKKSHGRPPFPPKKN